MWRVVIASVLAVGCSTPEVTYQVTSTISSNPNARLVFDDRLYATHTEVFVVTDYDELRDVAVSVTVRQNDIDSFVVLPFAASACGSEEWMHTGELTRIEVRYLIYGSGTSFTAYTDSLTCLDDAGEARTIIQ